MARRKKKQPPPTSPEGAATTSLGGLLAGLGLEASAPVDGPVAEPEGPPALDLAGQPKLVLRMERKGRGGKTVTLLEKLRADDDQRKELARRLAKALGTGVRVEGDVLVVQGDVRDRLRTWLRSEGVRKLVG